MLDSSQLQITIRQDGMEAFIAFSDDAIDMPVREKDVAEALRQRGVVFGLDEKAIREAVRIIRKERKNPGRVCAARGSPAMAGTPGEIDIRFRQGQIVRKGEVAARLLDHHVAKTGRTVTGDAVEPCTAILQGLAAGEHVSFDSDDGCYRADTTGYARIAEDVLHITPLFSIAEDGMLVKVTTSPAPPDRTPGKGEMLQWMKDEGITFGVIDAQLQKLLKHYNQHKRVKNMVIARGKPVIKGEDARLQFDVDAQSRVGVESEDGRLDYRKIHPTPFVKAGQRIAVKVPASIGSPGRNVFGESIPSNAGRDIEIHCGENVDVSQDGLDFYAAIDGIAFYQNHVLKVIDVYQVAGDVDFSTGDIDCDVAVYVRGTVRSTFSVSSQHGIVIGNAVEDAIVKSAGDVLVTRGVSQRAVGSVTAKGTIRAMYALHAQMRAGDSIILQKSAMHSFLAANHAILVTEGKGVVVGGRLTAGHHVSVRVAGSDMLVRTVLQAGIDFRSMEGLEKQLRTIEKEMSAILAMAGEQLWEFAEDDGKCPVEKKLAVQVKRWRRFMQRKQRLLMKREALLQKSFDVDKKSPYIEVSKKIHPGVVLVIGDVSREIKKGIVGGRFSLDRETNKIRRSG